jgi:hypothetical protein
MAPNPNDLEHWHGPGMDQRAGELGVVVDGEPADIDLEQWLAEDDTAKFDYVMIGDRRMKVGVLTQGEWEDLDAESRKPPVGRINPANPKGPRQRNVNWLARRVIAYAINKGAGRDVVKPEDLLKKVTGDLVAIQKAVTRLSGLDDAGGTDEVFS